MKNIRFVKESDAQEILDIYSPYILDNAISFEVDVPSVNEFKDRINSISTKYPFLVYEEDGKVAAYAYATQFAERAAYCFDVTSSIYVSDKFHGKGIAFLLYDKLFEILKEMGFYNVYAGYTEPNEKSRIFHEKCGFKELAVYKNVGYKFEKWHDVVWMEKILTPHSVTPKQLKSISDFVL